MITAGCNLAYVLSVLASAKPGDNIVLPAPWYFNHHMAHQMLGVETRVLKLSAAKGFVPDAADAARLIDARTRALVLVSPNNPTGAIYPPKVIEAFARLAEERGIFLILDETYRDFLSPGAGRPHELFQHPSWRTNLLQLYSFSKSYCIPGHRLGAITAGADTLKQIEKALDTLIINPPRPSQAAIAWGIPALAEWRGLMRDEIITRGAGLQGGPRPGRRLEGLGARRLLRLRAPPLPRPALHRGRGSAWPSGAAC